MNMQGKDKSKESSDPALRAGDKQSQKPENVDEQLREDEAEGVKATQFDGNPNVEKAPDSTFGPQDDTPWKLKKKD